MAEKRKTRRRKGERIRENIIGRTAEGRLIIRNSDGSISTERSITVSHPGLNAGFPTVIPTLFNGAQVSQGEAIRRMIISGGIDPDTGRLPLFGATFQEADERARRRSQLELGILGQLLGR